MVSEGSSTNTLHNLGQTLIKQKFKYKNSLADIIYRVKTLYPKAAAQKKILKIKKIKYMDTLEKRKRWRVYSKVKYGIKGCILERESCEFCERNKKHSQAHHPNYDFPYFILWLCPKCHKVVGKFEKESS